MNVSKGDVFAGLPAPVAVAFLRHFYSGGFAENFTPRLDPAFGTEGEALARLEAAGFVKRESELVDGTWWLTTIAGNALAKATFSPRITRATAERHVSEIVERATEVNRRSDLVFAVRRIRVFGSFLEEGLERLGDVDLGVSLVAKPHTVEDALHRAATSGKAFRTYIDQLAWPATEVMQILKNRARSLDMSQHDPSAFTDRFKDIFVDDLVDDGRAW